MRYGYLCRRKRRADAMLRVARDVHQTGGSGAVLRMQQAYAFHIPTASLAGLSVPR
jgi:hypothetical protein